jgi:hypothetical protein
MSDQTLIPVPKAPKQQSPRKKLIIGLSITAVTLIAVIGSAAGGSDSKPAATTHQPLSGWTQDGKPPAKAAADNTASAPAPTTTPPAPPTTVPPKPQIDPQTAAYLYKASAVSPAYDEFSKNPYGTGQPVHFRGQVFQFDGNTGPDKLLLAVTPDTIGAGTSYEKTYWSDNVFIQLPDAAIGNGIDKDDVVDVWGDAAGQYSYEAALGTRSVPSINARYFELVSKG